MLITNRAVVKIVSFACAIIAVLSIYTWKYYNEAQSAKRAIEYSYLRALEDLSKEVDTINTLLSKTTYASSPEMLTSLTEKMMSNANNARTCLAQLPTSEINMESTYKFLAQVADYSSNLAKKYTQGTELTQDELDNVNKLMGHADNLCNELWSIESQINQGLITFEKVAAAEQTLDGSEQQQLNTLAESFRSFEDGFEEYPQLIYDGPFSDHILIKEPQLIKNKPEISVDEALEIAAKAAGVQSLTRDTDEESTMPSYCFTDNTRYVSVTKNGGYLAYLINYRAVSEQAVTVEQAISCAKEYLKGLGIKDVNNTYYEIQGNVCIINFAGIQGDYTLYTDLIKVGVAMDNGEILSFDARGYIVNHHTRDIVKPAITRTEAAENISKNLTIESVNLCIIPSEGKNEIPCYEFSCVDKDEKNVLIYVNTQTGIEEQIFILLINDNGMLTV